MDNTLTIVNLEELLTDDLQCQSTHFFVPECSIEVTYIFTYCVGSKLMCSNVIEDPETGLAEHINKRGDALCGDCWNVRPV